MIGYFDYTVILTYLSLLSATTGIIVSLSGKGHPYMGMLFLLLCGLCDAFDGKVAKMKKNRSESEKKFGIQIDSLSDLVAFGVLPACIGASMIRISPTLFPICSVKFNCWYCITIRFVAYALLVLYALAALIRLAYFNVTEEERQRKEKDKNRKSYTGLPVTSSCLIFPAVMLLQYIIPIDITIVYFVVIIITGISFLLKFEIKKPELKEILFMVLIGGIEFILLILLKVFFHH